MSIATPVNIVCQDGSSLCGKVFDAETCSKGVVLIAPALGVPQKIYAGLARYLVDNGFSSLTFDYRACGENPMRSGVRLHEWGELDLDAAIEFALSQSKGPVFVLGHSIGAQLCGLAARARQLSGMISVAGSFPCLSRWPLARRVPLALLFRLIIPLRSALRPTFPAKRFGLGSFALPSSVMRDWSRWILHENYLLEERFGFDAAAYASLQMPFFALGFTDDTMVPESAFDKIIAAYPGCATERHYINPSQYGLKEIGHMGFFREQYRNSLWPELLNWLEAKCAA